jgi:hypothetical protein
MVYRAAKLCRTADKHANALTNLEIELMYFDFEHEFPHFDIRCILRDPFRAQYRRSEAWLSWVIFNAHNLPPLRVSVPPGNRIILWRSFVIPVTPAKTSGLLTFLISVAAANPCPQDVVICEHANQNQPCDKHRCAQDT